MNFYIYCPVCNDVGEGPVNDDRTDELIWSDIMAGESYQSLGAGRDHAL